MRHWTPEERALQSLLIRNWKPWNNSTGPRSAAGKVIVAANPFKGGVRPHMKELAMLLKEHKEMLKRFNS
jgi:hypothetical protein